MGGAEQIRDEIIEALDKSWGIKTFAFEEINRGYKNLKWKLETDRGPLFVKQYNWQRYSDLNNVKSALRLQSLLYKKGVPCPHIYDRNGEYIHQTPSGERFMLTDFCEGRMISAGKVNSDQMYGLGQATGRMHVLLNKSHTCSKPLHWEIPSKERMITCWTRRWHQATASNAIYYINALEKQKRIIDTIDLSIFSPCEKGWVHWDLWVDNLLFNENSLSAILDFDRLSYIYPEFDISRPILSCTLWNDVLNIEAADAFIKGYTESLPLTEEQIIRSIKLTWWKEAEWVGVDAERSGHAVQRFVDESIWVADHWYNLRSIFG
ncbi:phosphotransferase [Paenibacillus tarimensis]